MDKYIELDWLGQGDSDPAGETGIGGGIGVRLGSLRGRFCTKSSFDFVPGTGFLPASKLPVAAG